MEALQKLWYSLRTVSRTGQQDASPSRSRTVGAGRPPLWGGGENLPRQGPPRKHRTRGYPWGTEGRPVSVR